MNKLYQWRIFSNKDLDIFHYAFDESSIFKWINENKLIAKEISSNVESEVTFAPTNLDNIFADYDKTEEFYLFLCDVVENAHKQAQIMKQGKSVYGEKEAGAIKSVIGSLINNWQYRQELDVISMSSELIRDIACKHKFNDGNKRTSLITGFYFLNWVGLNIKYSQDEENWYKFIVSFLTKRVSHDFEDLDDEIKFIKDFIKQNIMLQSDDFSSNSNDLFNLNQVNEWNKRLHENNAFLTSLKKLADE
ncbi:type II toxin-antitoxin system death-on-curing family toxin [Mesoplasma lactucae]|uniref:Uncharacterized protein n=1 Tax=Mesoplasma lactucae ATCC 49193 TaxID=81460 RepID=A0A291ISV3_9MOLU|nr:type II toxin-antitoxin system death-on-curing family toxin [Mesoplasma lactucae]ATG97808.1 hypothetical protein CP520_03675 [Mesoplasma lactucae ATCC 49193]ATZ20413.1 hypothetical protein MLACT_v1c05920 [Mesoplasma lactucae ATCC 49193]MCL8216584.1 hypothetical protein [Mesoplasma lactucae ATCC 49193]